MQTVIGLFKNVADARHAVDELLFRKYDPNDISVVARDLAELHESPPHLGQFVAGAVGSVVSLSAFAIPYFGPVLATGPLLAALGGVGAEEPDAADWLVRALVQTGVPKAAAVRFSNAVRDGRAVVTVRAREVVTDNIAAVLNDCKARDVEIWPRPDDEQRKLGD